MNAISGVSACGDVTAEHLAAIRALILNSKDIKALKVGDFSGLTALRLLSLKGNQLSTLDASIFSNLTALQSLNLFNNRLSTLDASIFSNLTALKVLNLSNNQLSTLDASIFSNLTALTGLFLEGNRFSTLDASIFSNLTALETLYLGNNHQLTTLDADIFSNLTSLKTLNLALGRFSTLDADIFSNLTALEMLFLGHNYQLTTLDASIFSNLTALKLLNLAHNRFSTLDAGIFSNLTALETLSLRGNSVDPLPIILSLELIEEGQFKVRAHTGAPFNMVLPVLVANGTIVGDENSITISTGSVTSDVLTVSRTPGTTAAVTVDIGELPALPSDHAGYALVKSADLPLEAIAALIANQPPTFSETNPARSVAENTASGQNIGKPITATSQNIRNPIAATGSDGTMTYSLEGADADSFTIVPGTGQLQTKADVTYNYEVKNSYSVTVKVEDGQGGSATVDVTITLTDVNEPPSSPPSNIRIVEADGQLTVMWDEAMDEAGKPTISGYQVERRIGAPAYRTWQNRMTVSGRTTTSLIYTGLTNGQLYKVRVRTVNDEGESAWSVLPAFFLLRSSTSSTWRTSVQAKNRGEEPVLPDFSYAGYHYFGKPVPDVQGTIFDVTTYGAIPNDGLSDQNAIQSAIADAEQNNGGIVFFPPGEFLVNTDADNNQPIRIHESNIILRGSGSRAWGTVIRQVNHMPPRNPNQLWTSPYMFIFKPRNTSESTLTSITADATRETFWITVADASSLETGQWILLYMKNTASVAEFLAPYSAKSTWTSILNNGIEVREKHSIAEIEGNRIRLNEPLHVNVNHNYGWEVRTYPHLEEIGIEDISFHGSWLDVIVHNLNAIHAGGWSLLSLTQCVNSWVRRVSFINTVRTIRIHNSAAISVYHVTQAGNKGHFPIISQGSYGAWIGLSEDLAGHWHGPGTSGRSTGVVFWRYDMSRNQPTDAHGSQPYANLLDRVNGGILSGTGGSESSLPNHLRHYVLWNFNHGGNQNFYDFWNTNNTYGYYLQPIIVGFHGDPATFNQNNVQVLESNGSQVYPESLFEAQLEYRLRTIPDWLNDLRTQWTMLRNTPLPNASPVAKGTIAAQTLTVGTDRIVNVTNKFIDPDGDHLIYSASSDDETVATVSVSSSMVTITPGMIGNATITVRASDESLSAEQTIAVTVQAPAPSPAPVAMYWTNFGADKIQRANPDGSSAEDLITDGLGNHPSGIAILGDKMYWTDFDRDKIQRADLNGNNVEDLITGLSDPMGIALSGDKMYWTDFGTDKIQRADLDGNNVEDLITGLDNPVGIAIAGDKIYWVDRTSNKIQCADLDGSNVEDLITGLDNPVGIAVLGNKMYWTDRGADKIRRANLNGSNIEDLITGLSDPMGIALSR